MTDMTFSCSCGALAGTITDVGPKDGDYVYCHCHDCQAFAVLLGAQDRVLEQAMGTALYQTRCARLSFSAGKDKLACVHLTEKPTLRWYAACCDTPLFNTYANGKLPYTTVLLANCDADGRTALGQTRGHLHLDDAKGDKTDLKPMSMGKLLRSFFPRLLKDIFSGDWRRNALFDAKTFAPIASPRRLSREERDALV